MLSNTKRDGVSPLRVDMGNPGIHGMCSMLNYYMGMAFLRLPAKYHHLRQVLAVFLLFPSILGIALYHQFLFAPGAAHVHVHYVEASLLVPIQIEGNQIAAMPDAAEHTQVCMVCPEHTLLKHGLVVESLSAFLTMSFIGIAMPAIGTLVTSATIFLPEAFASFSPPPPRTFSTVLS